MSTLFGNMEVKTVMLIMTTEKLILKQKIHYLTTHPFWKEVWFYQGRFSGRVYCVAELLTCQLTFWHNFSFQKWKAIFLFFHFVRND